MDGKNGRKWAGGVERGEKEERRGKERRGEETAGLGARGGEARATDQEPGSRGKEQVQAVSEAFGPEGAARA